MLIPLKDLRKSKKMTQADLSRELNISPSSIGMWEQGRREPDLDNLSRIADFFGVSADYLLGRKVLDSKFSVSEEIENLLRSFVKLNKNNRKLILNLIAAFLAQQAFTVVGNVVNNNNNNGSGTFNVNNGVMS